MRTGVRSRNSSSLIERLEAEGVRLAVRLCQLPGRDEIRCTADSEFLPPEFRDPFTRSEAFGDCSTTFISRENWMVRKWTAKAESATHPARDQSAKP